MSRRLSKALAFELQFHVLWQAILWQAMIQVCSLIDHGQVVIRIPAAAAIK